MKRQSSKSETKTELKSKIEKILSEILSDKHDAKISIRFVENR